MTMTKEKAFDRAKVGLLQTKNSVFITTVLFSLKFSWEEDEAKCPTAQTNGLTLELNPKFFMSLSKEERMFLLAHEAWHVAFQHMLRMSSLKESNFQVWNMATDYYINYMLVKSGMKMPSMGLYDDKYADQQVWSADAIFDDLMKNQDQLPQDFECDFSVGGGYGDEDVDAEGAGMSAQEIQRKIEDIVIKASVQSKISGDAAGTVPGEIEVSLDKLINPKLPWNVILQNYMSAFAKEDYSWKRPNRRFTEVYMPSLYSESLGHIAIAVDTSCSVTDKQFTAFRSEIDMIQRSLNPESMTIVDFDTKIHKVHKVKQGDDVSHISFSGRGGTNMHPVFEHYNQPANTPKVLIVFSDMECSEIKDDPGYPVIWVRLEGYGFQPSFGRVIDFDV